MPVFVGQFIFVGLFALVGLSIFVRLFVFGGLFVLCGSAVRFVLLGSRFRAFHRVDFRALRLVALLFHADHFLGGFDRGPVDLGSRLSGIAARLRLIRTLAGRGHVKHQNRRLRLVVRDVPRGGERLCPEIEEALAVHGRIRIQINLEGV